MCFGFHYKIPFGHKVAHKLGIAYPSQCMKYHCYRRREMKRYL
jgi:hypothetical protein